MKAYTIQDLDRLAQEKAQELGLTCELEISHFTEMLFDQLFLGNNVNYLQLITDAKVFALIDCWAAPELDLSEIF